MSKNQRNRLFDKIVETNVRKNLLFTALAKLN